MMFCHRQPFPNLLIAVVALVAGLVLATPARAKGELNVVTTTEDLAALAREIGGDRVEVKSLARGYEDPHFVDAKPSFLVQLRRADVFIHVGRDLEVGWAPGLVNNARNPRILPGQPGNIEASSEVRILELPTAGVSRAEGDVHPLGNPHYWLDPENGRLVARTLARRFATLRPAEAGYFQGRLASFERGLNDRIAQWKARARSIGLTGSRVVTYHRSWSYFARAFGFQVIDFVEPKPGIPPSPGHVQSLIQTMRAQQVKLLLVEPYFDTRLPKRIASDTGAQLVVLPPSVGAEKGIDTYFELFDYDFDLLARALAASSGTHGAAR